MYYPFFIMITQITNTCGSIMKSPTSNEVLYIKEMAPQYKYMQNIINTHVDVKWHLNNIINKFIGKGMK